MQSVAVVSKRRVQIKFAIHLLALDGHSRGRRINDRLPQFSIHTIQTNLQKGNMNLEEKRCGKKVRAN